MIYYKDKKFSFFQVRLHVWILISDVVIMNSMLRTQTMVGLQDSLISHINRKWDMNFCRMSLVGRAEIDNQRYFLAYHQFSNYVDVSCLDNFVSDHKTWKQKNQRFPKYFMFVGRELRKCVFTPLPYLSICTWVGTNKPCCRSFLKPVDYLWPYLLFPVNVIRCFM